ncbi:cysteine desulfurase NifS [Endomicrobiia bacterium]|uniref:cysteine desulfurase n=1 Tax=Endomicrobium trichonymphae TaxID=1408204 RepID=B1H0H1_ENDTX|nr:IscS subfamily cysteine desulfurase [Candidatus Endomicrobium trichonymphae]GHT05510.1 cysteine desulfurase NifS [Endomicrobiia bacterium]BAG14003.1 cysteine desulfurase [Candidatus Endomicrobium trichonymphae]GHT13769.1 cysteine desulfurase NifS [Endomicrobiia bacterium]GHT19138.1 cysteine desulfurase NifS [Endomicrobiia bacterium]GHT28423.1 cysteine desulfurase NifS [Endomicrobiia bacterium]
MGQRIVYLDNSATTIVDSEVIKEMQSYFSDIYGNASSFHYFGRQAKTVLDNARKKTASLLNSSPEEIFFTGCGTESDNIAIFGILNAYGEKGHIITSRIEHHAVFYSCKHLEANGYEVTYLNVDEDGVVSVEDFKKAVKDNTLLVTIMHANNEVGSIQPIEEIASELKKINEKRKKKIYFHTDAVQTAGKLYLDVKKLGIDLLAISAHKFNGPKGVGALYIKSGTNIVPMTFGGHHENGLRPGTENIPYISGLAKALEISNAKIEEYNKRVFALRKKLKEGILNAIPEVIINGSGSRAVSNILNVSFNYIEGEALLLMLDMEGVAVSTGSACASGSSEPSHVLSAMGVNPVASQGAIRFSFGYHNVEEDVDYVLEVLPKVISSLRSMSPVWKQKTLGNKE